MLVRMVRRFDRVTADLEALGFEAAPFLDSALGRPVPVFRKEELESLIEESDLVVEELIERPLADGIALHLCRRRGANLH